MAEDDKSNIRDRDEERRRSAERSQFSQAVGRLAKATSEAAKERAEDARKAPMELLQTTVKSMASSIPGLTKTYEFLREAITADDDGGDESSSITSGPSESDGIQRLVGNSDESLGMMRVQNDVLMQMLGVWDEQRLEAIEQDIEFQRQMEAMVSSLEGIDDGLVKITKGSEEEEDMGATGFLARFLGKTGPLAGFMAGAARFLVKGALPIIAGAFMAENLLEGFLNPEDVLGVSLDDLNALESLGARILAAFKNVGDTLWRGVEMLTGISLDGVVEGVVDSIFAIQNFFSDLPAMMGILKDKAFAFLGGLPDMIKGFFVWYFEKWTDIFKGGLDLVEELFPNIFGVFESFFEMIGEKFGALLDLLGIDFGSDESDTSGEEGGFFSNLFGSDEEEQQALQTRQMAAASEERRVTAGESIRDSQSENDRLQSETNVVAPIMVNTTTQNNMTQAPTTVVTGTSVRNPDDTARRRRRR